MLDVPHGVQRAALDGLLIFAQGRRFTRFIMHHHLSMLECFEMH